MFQWACLFFGFGEWACEPIFQTLSDIIHMIKFIFIRMIQFWDSVDNNNQVIKVLVLKFEIGIW